MQHFPSLLAGLSSQLTLACKCTYHTASSSMVRVRRTSRTRTRCIRVRDSARVYYILRSIRQCYRAYTAVGLARQRVCVVERCLDVTRGRGRRGSTRGCIHAYRSRTMYRSERNKYGFNGTTAVLYQELLCLESDLAAFDITDD